MGIFLNKIVNVKSVSMSILGFCSGLPLLLVFSSISTWLREEGVSRSEIGILSLVTLIYGFKFIFAPFVDTFKIPVLYKYLNIRKSWIFLSLVIIGFLLLTISYVGIKNHMFVGLVCLGVAFFSSIQDISIDAYRIEVGEENSQGVLAAAYVYGYRIAMIVSGAGAIYLADTSIGWHGSYFVMGIIAFICAFFVLFLPNTNTNVEKINSVKEFVEKRIFAPFVDFFESNGFKYAFILLCIIALFRISDIVLGVMANVFYIDMGYTKSEIAFITKIYGTGMMLFGLGFAGALIAKFGVFRVLFVGAFLSSVSNLLFAHLYLTEQNITNLMVVISFDNFAGGFASCAFIAFMSNLVNKKFSATQYALFSSIMLIIPKIVGGYSGMFVDNYGYLTFFVSTCFIGIPVLFLLYLYNKKI